MDIVKNLSNELQNKIFLYLENETSILIKNEEKRKIKDYIRTCNYALKFDFNYWYGDFGTDENYNCINRERDRLHKHPFILSNCPFSVDEIRNNKSEITNNFNHYSLNNAINERYKNIFTPFLNNNKRYFKDEKNDIFYPIFNININFKKNYFNIKFKNTCNCEYYFFDIDLIRLYILFNIIRDVKLLFYGVNKVYELEIFHYIKFKGDIYKIMKHLKICNHNKNINCSACALNIKFFDVKFNYCNGFN